MLIDEVKVLNGMLLGIERQDNITESYVVTFKAPNCLQSFHLPFYVAAKMFGIVTSDATEELLGRMFERGNIDLRIQVTIFKLLGASLNGVLRISRQKKFE